MQICWLLPACYLVALQEERELGNEPVSVQLQRLSHQLTPSGTTLVATVKRPGVLPSCSVAQIDLLCALAWPDRIAKTAVNCVINWQMVSALICCLITLSGVKSGWWQCHRNKRNKGYAFARTIEYRLHLQSIQPHSCFVKPPIWVGIAKPSRFVQKTGLPRCYRIETSAT